MVSSRFLGTRLGNSARPPRAQECNKTRLGVQGLAIGVGRRAIACAETAGEMARLAEAAAPGKLRDADICQTAVVEKMLRLFETQFHQSRTEARSRFREQEMQITPGN